MARYGHTLARAWLCIRRVCQAPMASANTLTASASTLIRSGRGRGGGAGDSSVVCAVMDASVSDLGLGLSRLLRAPLPRELRFAARDVEAGADDDRRTE